jgi:hypothetical protein
MDKESRAYIQCVRCGASMTWADQRLQFGRAVRVFQQTPEQAKQLMPRCYDCLNILFPGRLRSRPGWKKGWEKTAT